MTHIARQSLPWLLCVLLATAACSDGSDGPLEAAPFDVVIIEQRFVDESRSTPPTGEFPALPSRTLDSLIFMPQGRGPFPLLVFSHGLGATPQRYDALLEAVATAGYIVIAPTFPLTNQNAPAGPDAVDTQQQPGDVSFLIDAALSGVAPFDTRVDRERVATFGHSNGGITTLGVSANSCCRDERIDAAVSLSATAAPFNNGEYDFGSAPPLLLIHGTADILIPFESSVRVFNSVAAAKGLTTLNDIGHSAFLQFGEPGFSTTVTQITDFFATHLRGDSAAEQRLIDGQTEEELAEALYTATGGTAVTLPLPPPITNRAAAVEPNSDLVDGQVVTVSWRNFIPGNVVNVLQCSQGGLGGNEVCDFGNARILEPNPLGSSSRPLQIIVGDVGSGRCDATTDDCVIVVNDSGLQTEEATLRIPISFAP